MKNVVRKLVPRSIWKRLRTWRVRRTLAKFKRYTTHQRFGPSELTVVITDPMAEAWYGRGGEELTEIELLRSGQLQSGATVFDLGAHQGVVALRLAHVVGPVGRVVAAEANAHNAGIAEENVRLNAAGNVCVEPVAVSSAPGELSFSSDWDGQSVGKGEAKVKAVTVDGLAAKHGWPQVLYIDVEGYECEVLAGASKTLERRPDCYIEVHAGCGLEDFGGSIDRLVSYFDSYRLYAIKPASSAESPDFIAEFDRSVEWTRERFYLVALANGIKNVETIV